MRIVKKSYLSIVATTRNDNHGGDLLERTTAFVKGIYHQAKKWDLNVELIIVEWNPPVDSKLLNEILPKPAEGSNVRLKYIVVPNSIHQTFKNSESIPLFQMIAKNIGIRRASGDFILCTNVDILFSDDCFKYLKEKKLKMGSYYRANRCDIPKKVLDFSQLGEQLEYAQKNILKRIGKNQGHEALSFPNFMYVFPGFIKLINRLAVKFWILLNAGTFPFFTIDFEACGDFTLMSRQDWEDIEGYPELGMYSIHIDSMGLWAANALEKKQVILPFNAPIYHIYHEDGWESEDVIRTIKFLETKPSLDYALVWKAGMQIVKNKKSWGLNQATWGLQGVDLKTYEF